MGAEEWITLAQLLKSLVQLDVRPTGDQEFAGSTPT